MFNVLTLTELDSKLVVTGIRMVGESVELGEGDAIISDYRPDFMGCEVVYGNVMSESGEVLYSLNEVQGE
ncbi:MAG: hypothetical protein CML20_20475 [Rheinheimera sp.]|nr:hypothetical protein [Rheinheimera sp.]|tara:strand:- start:11176 stop:11385 length:210 start_codon:yes stop_codon:yes gene_type:complete